MYEIKADIKQLVKDVVGKFSKKIPTPYPILNSNMLLEGRCALITGGDSGIGYAIAEQFVKNGASVIISGRNDAKLKKAAMNLGIIKNTKNQKIYYFKFDISLTDKIDERIDKIVQNIGKLKIDILVNNAGIATGENFGNATTKEFEKILKTNIEGTYFVSQKIYKYMIKNHISGNILNVLSSSSKRPAMSAYTLSKWALAGLTLGMAKKCIKNRIIVNGVAPGQTATKMQLDNPRDNILNDKIPIGRYIMPEEIANVAVMLVSDLGKCIVGDTIYATGGSGIITFDDIDY